MSKLCYFRYNRKTEVICKKQRANVTYKDMRDEYHRKKNEKKVYLTRHLHPSSLGYFLNIKFAKDDEICKVAPVNVPAFDDRRCHGTVSCWG